MHGANNKHANIYRSVKRRHDNFNLSDTKHRSVTLFYIALYIYICVGNGDQCFVFKDKISILTTKYTIRTSKVLLLRTNRKLILFINFLECFFVRKSDSVL